MICKVINKRQCNGALEYHFDSLYIYLDTYYDGVIAFQYSNKDGIVIRRNGQYRYYKTYDRHRQDQILIDARGERVI